MFEPASVRTPEPVLHQRAGPRGGIYEAVVDGDAAGEGPDHQLLLLPICTFNALPPPPITKGPLPVLTMPLATNNTAEVPAVCVPPLPAYWIVLTLLCSPVWGQLPLPVIS